MHPDDQWFGPDQARSAVSGNAFCTNEGPDGLHCASNDRIARPKNASFERKSFVAQMAFPKLKE